MAYRVAGITRLKAGGDPLGNCDVYLLKFNSLFDTLTQIDATVSSGAGEYELSADDDDPRYVVLAFEEGGAPVLAGVTRRDMVPVLAPDFVPTYHILGF